MLIDDLVKINPNPKTNHHYLDLGYDLNSGDSFFVKVVDLPRSSRVLVEVQCDYCSNIKKTPYREFLRNTSLNGKFSCSNKCGCLKKKELSIIKYGVDSPSKLKSIKSKSRKTNLERYGSEFYMSTTEFKEKSKKSNIKKYGTDNIMSLDFIKDKIKKTNLGRYGVENVFQSELIKDTIKDTNLERYGVSYYQSTNEFLLRCKNTNLERYGVDHPMKSKAIMDKFRDVNLERYGFESYMSTKEFKEKSRMTNLERYGSSIPSQSEDLRIKYYNNCKDVNYIRYDDSKGESVYKCNLGHEFHICSDNYISRSKENIPLCTICNPIGDSVSIKEKDLFEFIKSVYSGEIVKSYRDGLEIDIYIPELKLGFEFNGLYWHSNKYKNNKYHLNKTNHFKRLGIRIIHIWEDDWSIKKDILKSQIKNWLGVSDRKIGARNCSVVNLEDNKVIREFLDDNHIQGWCFSDINLGLIHKDMLVGIMCFNKHEGRKRLPDNEWCLSRYCNILNTNVIGGSSKVLSYFLGKFSPKRIISYSDKSWSIGIMYEKLGFSINNESLPDYKYILDGVRLNKSRFKKSELSRKFNCDINISESMFLRSKNIYKIYDCGKIKFELNVKY